MIIEPPSSFTFPPVVALVEFDCGSMMTAAGLSSAVLLSFVVVGSVVVVPFVIY